MLWNAARGIAVWLFGDDVVKYTLYVVIGLVVVVFLETSAVTTAITSQPWGQSWLVGAPGGAGSVSTQVANKPVTTNQVNAPLPTLAPQPAQTDRVTSLVAFAMTWLGTRYLWGGCSHSGIDCSCFMQIIFGTIGVHLPRVTVDQIRFAQPITAADARAGDLVFFDNTCRDCGANPTHVGMVLGGGKMVNAGDPVQVEPIFGGHNARYGRVLQ